MRVDGLEVVAVVGPITTLAGTLGAVWLTLRYQHGRELRDAKRVAYIGWAQFAENLGTWSFQPGAHLGDFLRGLHDRMVELDLVGSPRVRQAVRDYVNALGPVNDQVQAAAQRLGRRATPQQQAAAIADVFRAMDSHRERVLTLMRQDLGFK